MPLKQRWNTFLAFFQRQTKNSVEEVKQKPRINQLFTWTYYDGYSINFRVTGLTADGNSAILALCFGTCAGRKIRIVPLEILYSEYNLIGVE